MHTTKIEIKSTNIIMRTNAKIVDGKIKFPDEEVSYPINLKNLKPTGGTEDSCFVFYDMSNQIIARAAIHNYHVPGELRIIWETGVSEEYAAEAMTLWLNWLFENTALVKVWTLITGEYPECAFVNKYFKNEIPAEYKHNKLSQGIWYSLYKENWSGGTWML